MFFGESLRDGQDRRPRFDKPQATPALTSVALANTLPRAREREPARQLARIACTARLPWCSAGDRTMSQSLAPAKPFVAPMVDRLSVRVVVDSRYERFLPKATHSFVTIEHVGQIPGRQMTSLACEWGLSLHLESSRAGSQARYLLDFGYTPEIVLRNADLLDIDPAKIDGLILSHAHRDHFGGLIGFLMQHRSRMRSDLQFYNGGEDGFREKFLGDPKAPISWGAVDRRMLTAQLVTPVCCNEPHDLSHAFTTGYIERNSFEEVSGGSMVYEYDHFTEAERRGKLVKDTHPDEHATCYIVQGRGLVVISSCGHVGLVNTIKQAMAVSGVSKLHAVIGGFHLVTAPQEYIERTVSELAELEPDVVIPMHCSGTDFIESMRRRMPGQLVTTNVGTRFTFGV
jgi:7,8-dihydropterin-6-yl-methyl-4-(beta-D-ribofuranosyl)aminobenzene 5'-phosphate synthase